MSATTDIRTQLRGFIEENFLYLHPGVELGDQDNMLARGIIDSLGFVELVEEVQARFGIDVQDSEITEDNFGSIDALARYVESRRTTA